jgi:hypothetical protein
VVGRSGEATALRSRPSTDQGFTDPLSGNLESVASFPYYCTIFLRSRNANRDQANGRKGKTDSGGRLP